MTWETPQPGPDHPRWYYLSFAWPREKGGTGFLGACVVDGEDDDEAILNAHLSGVERQITKDVPEGAEINVLHQLLEPAEIEAWRKTGLGFYTLLTEADLNRAAGGAIDAADLLGDMEIEFKVWRYD